MADWVWKLHCPLCDYVVKLPEPMDEQRLVAMGAKIIDPRLMEAKVICPDCWDLYFNRALGALFMRKNSKD